MGYYRLLLNIPKKLLLLNENSFPRYYRSNINRILKRKEYVTCSKCDIYIKLGLHYRGIITVSFYKPIARPCR